MLTKAYIGLVVWVELNCLIQIISMPWRLSKFSTVTYSLLARFWIRSFVNVYNLNTANYCYLPVQRHTFDLAFPLSINKSGIIPPKLWNVTKASIWAFHALRKSKIVAHASWLKDSVACRPRNGITHQADAEDNLPTAYVQLSLLCQFTSMFSRC